jgi:hypothetical protein
MTTSKTQETQAEKPKSSLARKLVLLLLLVATIIVVGLDYLPESGSEPEVVGPTKKARPATRAPAQPQGQQPATPQRTAPPQQQKRSPAPAPTPPRYERPSTTVFVSASPSDAPAPPAEAVAVTEAPPEPAASEAAVTPTEPAPAAEMPAESVAAAAEPVDTATTETPPAEAVAVTEAPAAPETPAELVAARSPASSSTPGQDDSELVVAVGQAESSLQAARPLPKGPVPVKVERYAQRLFDRYDTNRDGVIDAVERRQMQGNPAMIDYSADGEISLEELAAYTADFGRHRRMRLTGTMVEEAVADLPPLYIPTAQREAMAAAQAAAQQTSQQAQAVPVALVDETGQTANDTAAGGPEAEVDDEPEQPQPAANPASSKRFVTPRSRQAGLPGWFLASDNNGDGQVTVAEYAPSSEKSRLAAFARFDRNKDGVLTAQECPKK